MATACNLLIILLELVGLYQVRDRLNWKIFAFYTQLSNLIAFISSIWFVCSGRAVPARYLSTCMLTMTLCVTVFVLIPMGGKAQKLLFSGNGLYHHTLCPLISLLSYAFFEEHVQGSIWLLFPASVTLVYGLIMLWLNARRIVEGPYPFFKVYRQTPQATFLWMLALTALVSVGSWGIAAL